MTDTLRAPVEPAPDPEVAAAILAALETLREEPQVAPAPEASPNASPNASLGASAGRSRWRLAGLLGHPPRRVEQEGPLWSHTRWEDTV